MEECIGNIAGDQRTALFRIDVIEIPISDPSKSKIVSSPAVFADPETGALGGLWEVEIMEMILKIQKELINVMILQYSHQLNIAAGACSGNGILFDISDPYNPKIRCCY
jgi:hypothetical protein